jgi:hypothetical protein
MHSVTLRTNSLLTYAGSVLAVMCLAVTLTGKKVFLHVWCQISKEPSEPSSSSHLIFILDDAFVDVVHKATTFVDCAFVGIEGLQKEFGHDRVCGRSHVTSWCS